MRRAMMRDRNEGPIVARLKHWGYLWLPNNASTTGRPDGCALLRGTLWCEIKEPGEPFTEAQMRVFEEMRQAGVPVYVLESPDDVDNMHLGMLPAWTSASVRKVWSKAGGRKKQREHRPGYDKARDVREMCARLCCATSHAPGKPYCHEHASEVQWTDADRAELLPPPRKGRR